MRISEKRITNSEQRIAFLFFALSFSLFTLSCRAWAASDSYLNYLQGMVEEKAGHTAKALEAYDKVVQEDPQALQVYRDIAELRLRLGQPDAALHAAERAKDLAPKDPASFIFLGNVLVAQGNLAKAAEAYEQALQLDPENQRALENLGNYYSLLDPDKALTFYQRYIDINPRDPDIYFQMALVYQKRGNLTKAKSLYLQSLDLDNQQLGSHLALADLYEQQKSTAAAVEEYKTAAQLQPANPMIFMRLGNLYYHNRDWDDAEKVLKATQAISPQEPTVYYWLARVAEEKKNWKEAAADAEKAYTLSLDPQFLPLTAYYMTLDRQVDNAVKYLEKAKETEPNNANVLLFLGMNYVEQQKFDKAVEVLQKGVSLYPRDGQMRFQLAMAEDRLGRFDDSVKQFEELLKFDPKNAAALNYLGYSWADRGVRLDEAEKLLRRAVALEPDSGAYLDSLGWVRLKRGDASEARNLLEKAAMYSPDPLIFDHLGDASLADKHPEAALQAWSKALSMDPKNEAVRKKLMDEGTRFLSSPDAKKYLTYLEGNLKQISNASADFSFEGRLQKHELLTQGKLYVAPPDHARLDVPAGAKSGAMQFSLNGTRREVIPARSNPMLSQLAFDGLSSVTQFLSGQLTASLKTTLDPKTGLQVSFSHPNPSGGQDVIDVVSYDFVEGLWLPAGMHVRNATTGWEAKTELSGWVVNQPAAQFPLK